MANTLDFNLSLAVEADQTIAGLLDGTELAPLAADSEMTINVSADDLSGIFKFQTDSTDLADASDTDIKYACDSANWPSPSFAGASVTGTKAGSTNVVAVVKEDMLRHVAKDIFGTHFGVDLLSNEEEIQEDIVNLDDVLRDAIVAALNATGGTTESPKTRADTTGNYAKEVLDRLIHEIKINDNQDARIRSDAMLAGTTGGFNNFVFQPDDVLTFKVTYNPKEGHNNRHGDVLGSTMTKRSYLVKLVVE